MSSKRWGPVRWPVQAGRLRRRLRSGRIRWRIVGIVALVVVILLVLAPLFLARAPLRDSALQSLLPPIHGRITAESASLAWWSSPNYRDLWLRLDDGSPLLSIGNLETERSLWGLLRHQPDLGKVRMKKLRAEVVLGPDGSNFERLVRGVVLPPPPTVDLDLRDVQVSLRGPQTAQPIIVGPLEAKLSLRSKSITESGRDEVTIRKGTCLHRLKLDVDTFRDIFRLAAPQLKDAPQVSAEVSLDLDDWHLVDGDPQATTGSGQLVLHALEVQPNAMIQSVARLIGLPSSLRLAQESSVRFRMEKGKFYHENLVLVLPTAAIRSNGWVSVDQRLEIDAEIAFRSSNASPAADPFAGQTTKVAVRGTLHEPQIDLGGFRIAPGQSVMNNTVNGLLDMGKSEAKSVIGQFRDRLLDSILPAAPPSPPKPAGSSPNPAPTRPSSKASSAGWY